MSGSLRSRELRETADAWNHAEAAWRGSPLSNERHTFNTAASIVREVRARADEALATQVLVECALAADAFIELEEIGPFELNWPLIETDAAVAVAARQMIVRRRRWVLDYSRMMAVLRRQLVDALTALVRSLPESCFDAWQEEDAPFTVPLVSLLEEPAALIERLILSLYDDDTLSLEIFLKVREQLATNLLVASGFPPTTNIHDVTERLVMPTRQKNKSPAELADLYLAGTPFEALMGLPVPFSVPDAARFEHCHIVGGTGHGKTQLMQRMIHADLTSAIHDGRSVVVIDSQGDLIQKLVRLDLFSPARANSLADRLVLIDPADVEFPAALNLFAAPLERVEAYSPADRERVLNGVVELYETFFGALLGAELTQKQGVIFRYLARLMLAIPGATIQTLMDIMDNGQPYRPYMERLDGSARLFFEKEFFHPSFAATKKQILKRLWGVLSTPAFERMFAQEDNTLDLFEATRTGKIILISTAKDLLKTEGSQLLGRFFLAMLAQAALERSTLPESKRTPTFVYVDEAQEYFDDTIETILSQARKYRVGLTLAHQALDQLSPRLRAAFLANTSFKCAGGVSSRDARALAPELRTTSEFIESMRRRGNRTEFAVWLKHRTPTALQLAVPLGFLERQPTLCEDEYDVLLARNRDTYCRAHTPRPYSRVDVDQVPPRPLPRAPEERPSARDRQHAIAQRPSPPGTAPALPPRDLGKGGPKHRYLQSLVKELAEQQGFRATIEAPLPSGTGQIDVLLERDGVSAAVEISVTTPADYERQNVRKCLDAGFAHVALVLTKSRASRERYTATALEGLSADEQSRVRVLVPEEVPAFIAELVPAPAEPAETMVAGYKVRVSRTTVSDSEAEDRRARLAKLLAKSLSQHKE